jgi:hypothetical protein
MDEIDGLENTSDSVRFSHESVLSAIGKSDFHLDDAAVSMAPKEVAAIQSEGAPRAVFIESSRRPNFDIATAFSVKRHVPHGVSCPQCYSASPKGV